VLVRNVGDCGVRIVYTDVRAQCRVLAAPAKTTVEVALLRHRPPRPRRATAARARLHLDVCIAALRLNLAWAPFAATTSGSNGGGGGGGGGDPNSAQNKAQCNFESSSCGYGQSKLADGKYAGITGQFNNTVGWLGPQNTGVPNASGECTLAYVHRRRLLRGHTLHGRTARAGPGRSVRGDFHAATR
jgi:hypothetical protein